MRALKVEQIIYPRQNATHHGHGIELLQTAHRPQQQDDDTSSLNRLDRPGEQIGRQSLKVLENEHTKGLTEDLCRVLVVAACGVR